MKFNLKQNNNEESNVEWVSWSQDVKKVGDQFSITPTVIRFKEESAPVFFLIDEENEKATSVFCTNHPDSPYPDATPHGVRLANAIGRAYGLEGEVEVQDLLDAFNADPKPVQVIKTEKGVLWALTV